MKKRLLALAVCFCALFSVMVFSTQNIALAAQTQGVVSTGVIYNIRAVHSGKNLDVYYGTDANGTNVIQYAPDSSNAQKFRLVYDSASDSYYIKAYCSSQGKNRHLDVYSTSSAPIANGSNIHIWTPGDANASQWKIVSLGSNRYKIVLRYNTNLALTVAGGSTANGTGTGKSSSSPGNVIVATYTGATHQQWKLNFAGVDADPTPGVISGEVYYLKNKKSGKYLQPVGQVIGNGNNMEQAYLNGSKTQKWKITRQGDGTYGIMNMGSVSSSPHMKINCIGGYEYSGGYMCIWSDSSQTVHNSYIIAPASSGAYKLMLYCGEFNHALRMRDASPQYLV